MATAFRVVCSLAIAILFIVAVIYGISTFYDEPARPARYYEDYDSYRNLLADYHRDVFIVSVGLGAAAIAIGVYMFRRIEALPLGSLMGGVGVVLYGWAQAGSYFGDIGAGPFFATAATALIVVLVLGYRFLGLRGPPSTRG